MGDTSNERNDLPGGVLDLLILQALARENLHGFGIAQYIHEKSGDVLAIGEGTLYPTLQRLLVKGWLRAEWGISDNNRRARYYKLTAAGRKQLGKELAQYKRVSEAVARILEPA